MSAKAEPFTIISYATARVYPRLFCIRDALPFAMAWFRELKMRLLKRERKGEALDENFLCNGAGIPAPFLYKGRIAAGNGLVLRTQNAIAET